MERVAFTDRLYELMSIRKIKQIDIVNKTKITKSLISSYLNGSRVPKQDKVMAIAEAYNVDPVWLMGFDVPMEKKPFNPDEVNYKAVVKSMLDKELNENIEKLMNFSIEDKETVYDLINSIYNRKYKK